MAREEAARSAYSTLESFVSISVQVPARDCLEAVTRSVNFSSTMKLTEARAVLASYAQRYEAFATEFNKEIDDYNALIYSVFTPIWRAVLSKARRDPLPYHVRPELPIPVNTAETIER
jgi:hypothetical protein